MKTDFRHDLRQKSHDDHERLDQSISVLDLQTLSGFTLFVQLHHYCFAAIETRVSDESRCKTTLREMIENLQSDLRTVSANEITAEVALPSHLDPLAIDYMIAGSRLGTQVLGKRWTQAKEPLVRRANHYFGQPSNPTLWRDACQALSDIPVDSLRANAIVEDTRLLFQFFATVLDTLVDDQDALV